MPDTLACIYARTNKGLFMLALSITRSRADAEDAIHDVFTRLIAQSVQLPADPTSYVFSAVRNAAIDRLRRRSPHALPEISLMPCIHVTDRADAAERDLAIAQANTRRNPFATQSVSAGTGTLFIQNPDAAKSVTRAAK